MYHKRSAPVRFLSVVWRPVSCRLFFLKRRRLQRSTLFPYTTLFRSLVPLQFNSFDPVVGIQSNALIVVDKIKTDRKSTRLNSSHANISYAVFCLKKKKKGCLSCRGSRHANCNRDQPPFHSSHGSEAS